MELGFYISWTFHVPGEGDTFTFCIGYLFGTTVQLSTVQKGNYLFPVPGVDLSFLPLKTYDLFPVCILAKI